MHKKAHFFSPSRTILLSMIATIFIGTLALSLPCARLTEISFIDLLFTSTSATCVTGLLTVPIESFSTCGLWIIMFLMQIGGLGLVTLSLFVVSLFMNLGMATQATAGEILDLESWKDARKIILFIISMTAIVEVIGAVLLYSTLQHSYPFFTAIFYAIFHSISGFCNAGIVLFPNDLTLFTHNWLFLLTIAGLMFIGGFGFISWKEIFRRIKTATLHKKFPLSLQTKIILRYYGFFTLVNTILFWILERSNTLAKLSFPLQWLNAFFMSISSRSGGFFTVHLHEVQNASLFSIMINAFIGAAPGSTGSGIKLTTLALVFAVIGAVLSNKHTIAIKGRNLMIDQIYRAITIILISIAWILGTMLILLISERHLPAIDLLFEVVSSFSTLGASIDITSQLSLSGKYIIICNMLAGRIGVMSILLALFTTKDRSDYSYPEERVMIT